MRAAVAWCVENIKGMNVLMIAVLVIGLASGLMMRRESFPEFDLDRILVAIPYPGATPTEVEEGICLKVEEAVRSIAGIKKVTSVAQEGVGQVVIELASNVTDPQEVLAEVRSEVDRIPSFPVLAEDPEITLVTLRTTAIRVSVLGPEDAGEAAELRLRAVAESIRDEMLLLDSVSQAEFSGAKDFQIDIEIPEETLRKYNLSLQQVAQRVRQQNLDLPGGKLKTASQEVILRGDDKRMIGRDIARIPLLTRPNGTVLTVGDIGSVRDGFEDQTLSTRINGRPGLTITVQRTSSEDLLRISDEVRQYAAARAMPPGYELVTWNDASVEVRDRIRLLGSNGVQGLLLVFLVLALFLQMRLAFWVAVGIPLSVLGACGVMLLCGASLNMISMFGFLMALGIVVDDAIVIGENIYVHRTLGKSLTRASIEGTLEVLPSVTVSVATTVIAFLPLFFVEGVMGKFIAVMPLAMIAMLIISLFESVMILPGHLSHEHSGFDVISGFFLRPFRPLMKLFQWGNRWSDALLSRFIEGVYLPVLRAALRNPLVTVSSAVAMLLAAAGFVRSGAVPFNLSPKLDSNQLTATVLFPDGTLAAETEAATRRMELRLREIAAQYRVLDGSSDSILRVVQRSVGQADAAGGAPMETATMAGGHIGGISVELVDPALREIESEELIAQWREAIGEIPGLESLTIRSMQAGPGGQPIEFKLLAPVAAADQLAAAVEEVKAYLAAQPGVFDVTDDATPGKSEMRLRIKDNARSLGVSLGDLAQTVRASYYGDEVMRLQRGRHEVKLMVRYPRSERRSVAALEELRVRANDGREYPITELAAPRVERGLSEVNRVDQLRSVTVSADLNERLANAREITRELQSKILPPLLEQRFPQVSVRWEGQQEQSRESLGSMARGFAVAMAVMFVLLVFRFQSYMQPLLIMAIIPFGFIGAVGGHYLMGLYFTMFSAFGLVALTGVVVNDSIVLIDFINDRVGSMSLEQALLEAGRRRFRPVLLTSITTVAGLLPLLFERSFQAQILIPMATSLCFGLLFATGIVLLLVPSAYHIVARVTELLAGLIFGQSTEPRVSHAAKDSGGAVESGKGTPGGLAGREPEAEPAVGMPAAN